MPLIPTSLSDQLYTAPPLRKTRVCGMIDVILIGLLVLAVLIHLSLVSHLDADVAAVYLRALAISSVLSLVPISILWFLDRRERESPWMLALAFLWGGVIATTLSLPLNTALLRAVDRWIALNPMVLDLLGPNAAALIAAPLSAPIVEEVIKAAGVALILWMLRGEFDGMRDGFVYGAMVGVGFNWFEAPLYVAQTYAQFGTAGWGMQLGWRYALFGFAGHAMFTGLFGASLGLALQTRRRWLKLAAPILGLALAVLAHAYNNVLPLIFAIAARAAGEPPPHADAPPPDIGLIEAWVSGSLAQLTLFLPFVLLLGFGLWRSGVWERRVIREELADEVGRSVTRGEYGDILRDRAFRTRRIDALHPAVSAALVNAQHELAFRKRRARDEGRDPDADPLVLAWRDEIRMLRELVD